MRLPIFATALILVSAAKLAAHPIPDIPIRGTLEADGTFTIQAEVDPRVFEADWEMETYLLKIQMDKLMSPAECEALKTKARAFVDKGVEFFFDPQGPFKPEFTWEFTTLGGGPLVNIDDPVMVTGTWHTKNPGGKEIKSYRIGATTAIRFAVVFSNTLHGKPVERTAVLFPGEKSFTLDMSGDNASAASAPPEITADAATESSAASSSPDAPEKPNAIFSYWLKRGVLLAAAIGALALAWFVRA